MKFKALTPLAITVLIIAFIFGVFLLTADRQYNDASQDYIYTPSLEVRYDTIYIYGFKDASKIYIAPDNSDDAEVIKLNAVEIGWLLLFSRDETILIISLSFISE